MEFDPAALAAKTRHLDDILADPDRLARVLRALLSDAPAELTPLARPWEPGGGATLFRVTTGDRSYFLKVKHLAVTVESKLEGEAVFSGQPSLRNEQRQLLRFAGERFVPVVHGYAEDGDHAFLLLEWLEPFDAVAPALGPAALADVYRAVVAAVRTLYAAGVVHTDVHEKNLMFRGTEPVLVDFEEARDLVQTEPFEASLDVVGRTAFGDVGAMPDGPGRIGGLTCLARLHEVFAALVRPQLPPLLDICNFDSACPFLTALDHGRDERIYQTIEVPGLAVAGQRPAGDPRVPLIAAVGARLFDRPYTHLDVGANVGMFNVQMARRPEVRRSIGVEAYAPYVELAKVLAFLAKADDAEFHCLVAGEDSLAERFAGTPVDLVTIYSVYHHIRNTDRFLADLAALRPAYVMLELATQPECYEGRTWEAELERVSRALAMPYGQVLGESADYARPIVVLSRLPLPANLAATLPPAESRGTALPPDEHRAPAVPPPAALRPAGATSPAARTTAPLAAVAEPPAARPPAPAAPLGAAGPVPHAPGHTAPRVSVVLPVYNHLRFLPEAIASVLGQTYRDFELVIVNDGSTDGTRAYLDALDDPRIVVVHQENRRLPGALNTGFVHARGELFTWISADNYCAPLFLEGLVGALDHYPDAGFAYSAFAWIDDEGRITGVHRDQEVSVRTLFVQNPGIASFLYRRGCQEAAGGYDPALEGAEDWDMWLRIVERTPAVYVPEVLYYYRLHADSMTATKREQIAAASRQVVRNAIARRGRLDVEELFPTLTECADRGEAELYACAVFGTALLRSPWGPPELAAAFLSAACSVRPEPAALANYAIACARLGRFDEVRRALDPLRTVAHTDVRRLVAALEAALRAERADLAAAIAPFGIDTSGVELFERERARRRVYALTAPAADDDAQRAHPATAAPAPCGPPPVAPHEPAAPAAAAPARPRPLVSVIVPTHDRPETLRTALESILTQTFRDFEIVVVNDAGVDVQPVIDALPHEGRISYVRHAVNRGLAAARNSGLGVARGRFIAYLDDDDRFYPEHLETLVAALADGTHPVVYSDALRVTQAERDGRYVVVARDRPYSNDFERARLLVNNQFPVLCVMHARTCLDAVGGFDESLTSHEDWDLWLRMSARFPFRHVPSITAEFTHRVDGTSMTSSMQPDYLRTLEIIYARTAHEVAGHAELEAQRARFAGALRARAQGNGAPAATAASPAGASTAAAASSPAAPAGPAASAAGPAAFDCSIVIPVFNRAELTEQCLVRLAAVTTGVTYEVVIVDNASTDGTAALLATLGGDVQIIRNAENRGFAAACNQGARAARGRHLVFLNNDTLPLAGWLEALVAELDTDPATAVVGSKLLFADGTIQHAGVVFMRDLPLPYHPFSRAPAALPAANVRRELQCVTGACMAVRRDVFEALGGFDEGFRNGYEDVDFCLRVGRHGGRVVYQPASVLHHLESQTAGRKDHDQANWQRLLDRWGAEWARIGDEDVVLAPDGWCPRERAPGERRLEHVTDAAERRRWDAVGRAQQALRADDREALRALFAGWHDWPVDPGVERWLERVRRLTGIGARTAAAGA